MTLPELKHNQPPTGGFSLPIVGYGGKGGGGSARTPREDPDSLHSTAYARVIDFISEGEVFGPTHGGDGLSDVLLDGTRVKNEDGSVNIAGVSVDFRPGTQYQDPIPGFPASENTVGVGVELKATTAWIRTFTDTQLNALRLNLTTTQYEVKANGDRVGYRIEYAIDLSTDGAAFQEVLAAAFDGKTTSSYTRSHRIDLPEATSNWRIRVRRLTSDSTTDLITSTTRIESVVEIVDAKLRYPMSALAGIVVDASQFSAVPTRAYDMKGRIVRVPSNYDADTRAYAGTWDGTYKLSWTDCPPWIFYDLVSNDRYGLGHLVPAGMLDKWGLYQIGQYCDELVPNGFGTMEPRFTCNVYLQQAADAYRVLQDLAGCFRGMSYAAGGGVFASADIPTDPADWYTFSNANVIDGKFTYGGTSRRSRFTVALVSWTDLDDLGRQKVEVVEDRDSIARFGLRQTEVTAFGCTSQGQAHRVGKWLLMTSQVETRTVSFQTGLEHARIMPGKIIRVADQHLAGRRIGGRIVSATGNTVTVDMEIGVRPGDRLVVNLPSGISQERIIQAAVGQYITADQTTWTVDTTVITADMVGLPGSTLTITVTQPFTETPAYEAQWVIESEELSYQTFRVVSVMLKEGLIAEITALQHTPSKYDAIDYGTKLQPKPITIIPPSVQTPPTNVVLSAYSIIDQGIATHNAVIQWQPVANAIAYEVEWRRDNSDWIVAGRTGANNIEVRGIFAGAYVARVRAINGMEISSNWAFSAETVLDGFIGAPPMVTSLTTLSMVFGIQLRWGFPDTPTIIGKTELWYGLVNDRTLATKLGDFAYPQNTHMMMGIAAGQTMFFWARLVDKNGLEGPFYPSGSGVVGQSSSDATQYLSYFNNLLQKDQLAQSLISYIDSKATDLGPIYADIEDERIARVDADGALAQDITTTRAEVNGAYAAVQTNATAISSLDGRLSATYTIKTQVTQFGQVYVAGMGLGAYDTGQGIQTSAYFLADRFAFINVNNGVLSTPFVIQGGQTFINQAFIGQAWINSANIADWLQSDALNQYGQRVFALNMRSGEMQFNGTANAAGRMTLNNRLLQVFDGNGTERVRLGIW